MVNKNAEPKEKEVTKEERKERQKKEERSMIDGGLASDGRGLSFIHNV